MIKSISCRDRKSAASMNLKLIYCAVVDRAVIERNHIFCNFIISRGCIPFKYRNVEKDCGDASEKTIEILMITSTGGPGLVFPKGGWEVDETAQEAATREAMEEAGVRGDLLHFLGFYAFKGKTIQEECRPDGLCKAAMYALHVKEELESWPEKSYRGRHWLTIHEAIQNSRHAWMRDALEKGFTKWYADGVANTLSTRDHPSASRIM